MIEKLLTIHSIDLVKSTPLMAVQVFLDLLTSSFGRCGVAVLTRLRWFGRYHIWRVWRVWGVWGIWGISDMLVANVERIYSEYPLALKN